MERPLTPEERKKIDAGYKDADPTTFSQLPPTGPLREIGESEPKDMNRTYPILSDGEDTYVEIPKSRFPARQQAVTRILKGVVNVSDMVTDGWSYYSKVLPLEKIQSNSTPTAIQADLIILDITFGDWDHDYMHDGETNQNMRETDGKVAYFDFNEAKPDIDSRRISPVLDAGEYSKELLEAVSSKLDELLVRYGSEEGEAFLGEILDSVSANPKSLFNPIPKSFVEQEMDDRTRFIKGFVSRIRANKALVDARLAHLSA